MGAAMRKKENTFQRKLDSMFIISVIVPLGIAIFIILFYVSYSNQEREYKDMDNVLESISRNVENQFAELKNIGNTFYMQNRIFQVADRLNNPELYAYNDPLTLKQAENDYCITMGKHLYLGRQDIRGVMIFPVNSEKQVGYYLGKEASDLVTVDYKGYQEEDWFVRAVEHPEHSFFLPPHERNYMEGNNPKQVYSLIQAVRNMDNNKVIAVIKVDSRIQEIQDSINVVKEEQERGIVLSCKGEIAARSELMNGEINLDTGEGKAEVDGRIYYARMQTVENTDWELYYLYSLQYSIKGYLY